MTDNDHYESLLERFNIEKLDFGTRSFAGIYSYGNGKVYCGKEHLAAIEQCRADNPHMDNRMSFLQFVKRNDKLTVFVDGISLFGEVEFVKVVDAIVDRYKEELEVYEYKYPNQVRQIYSRID